MRNGPDRLFGLGLGVGVLLGLFLGSILAARLGTEAAEIVRSVADRMLCRGERIRFEALIQ